MSGGRVHDGATIVGAGLTWLILNASPVTHPLSTTIAIGTLVGGLLLSPDMDCKGKWGSKSLNRWKVGKLSLKWLWKPYQAIAPHRSWVSHSPFIGSIGRLLYLTGILTIATLGIFPFYAITQFGLSSILAFAVGNEIGSAIHLIADGLYRWFYIGMIILAIAGIKAIEVGMIVFNAN